MAGHMYAVGGGARSAHVDRVLIPARPVVLLRFEVVYLEAGRPAARAMFHAAGLAESSADHYVIDGGLPVHHVPIQHREGA